MKLKRLSAGDYVSACGQWRFEHWEASDAWFVRERCDGPELWHEEPATYDQFLTLWEAASWAKRENERRSRSPS